MIKEKTFKIFTLGCKVNQYESQQMRESYLAKGYKELDNGELADCYIINTCTVTANADKDSYAFIRKAERENPKAKVYVTGCLVKNDRNRIREVSPLAQILEKSAFRKGISGFHAHTRAFLKIQDGCNNFCSYCKVPLVRSQIKSKPIKEIISEARGLINNGYKEIVLCGICLGKHGRDLKEKNDLVTVIKALENIEGEFRLRLSSIEAGDVSERLIKQFESSKKLCPHLHIPLQSGDGRILKLMHRKYEAKDFIALVNKLKKRIPSLSITTDVLVGFPTENAENFKNTARVLKAIMPLRTHIFPFSARPGTVAWQYHLKSGVPQDIVRERASALKKLSDELSYQFRKKFLNKELEVLCEGDTGYAQNYILVDLGKNNGCTNEFLKVKVGRLDKKYTFAAG